MQNPYYRFIYKYVTLQSTEALHQVTIKRLVFCMRRFAFAACKRRTLDISIASVPKALISEAVDQAVPAGLSGPCAGFRRMMSSVLRDARDYSAFTTALD